MSPARPLGPKRGSRSITELSRTRSLACPFRSIPIRGRAAWAWCGHPWGAASNYRFIEEDDNGWRPQVAFFPQAFIPVGPANRGAPVTELFPVWLQKSLGDWTMFGGGG